MSSDDNLCCPTCHDVFQEPIILECSHSFCKVCWETWCRHSSTSNCPVCKKRSSSADPPRNLALKNLIETVLQEKSSRSSCEPSALCGLHLEKLGLFCLDHQQPVCVVCSHSKLHANHSFSPIDEAAADCKNLLREQLRRLHEGRQLLSEEEHLCSAAATAVEAQARDLKKRIKGVFSQLKAFLADEEEARLAALKAEAQEKQERMRSKAREVGRELEEVSDTVRSTEELLACESVQFLRRYKASAARVQESLPQLEYYDPGGPIDARDHVTNLTVVVLDKMMDAFKEAYQSPNAIEVPPGANEENTSLTNQVPARSVLPPPPVPPYSLLPQASDNPNPNPNRKPSPHGKTFMRIRRKEKRSPTAPNSDSIYTEVDATDHSPTSDLPLSLHEVNFLMPDNRKLKLRQKPGKGNSDMTKKRNLFLWQR
ncbi:unnamed protein product [Ophioblennius macclurei]